jgi:hypothetical protein
LFIIVYILYFVFVVEVVNHDKKTAFVRSNSDKLSSHTWLESELNNNDIRNIKQTEGVYLCASGPIAAAVVLIDYCKDSAFLQAGFLNAIPHILIADNPVYGNSLQSVIIHISEFQSGLKIIANEIRECLRSFRKSKCVNPLACVIPAIPTYCDDRVILSRIKNSIYVNGIEVIKKKRAKMKFDLICVFIEMFMDDFRKEKDTYLNVYQISDKLSELGHNMNCNSVNRIRQIIRKIQISFQEIADAEIISNVYLSGYQLNAQNIFLKISKT